MNEKYFKYAIVIILLIAGVALWSRLSHPEDPDEITLEDTPTLIESTRPIGILYLYTTVTEDYVKSQFRGSGLGTSVFGKNNGILKMQHDCVQILRQQVSLTMDLDLVRYEPIENSDTVVVRLPYVDFTQSTLSSWFKSDDEDEESAVNFDAKQLIKRTEWKIAARYDTPENRAKAEAKAKQTIADFLKQCGKVAVFR